MLVLSRNINQEIIINDDIRINVTAIKGKAVKLGISAPESIKILRKELYTSLEAYLNNRD